MTTFVRKGQVFPYDEKMLKWYRKVDVEDLMQEDSPEPNDAVIEEVKAAAEKHFHLLRRREMPKWEIASIDMVDPAVSNHWNTAMHEEFHTLTLTDFIFRKWYNSHPEEMVTYFRPAGLFRKEYREEFTPMEVPNQSYVLLEFVCTMRFTPDENKARFHD